MINEYFYIDEVANRTDGVSNQSTTGRSSLALALAYYYERHSKLCASTEFVSYCLGVRTNTGRVIMPYEIHDTAYTE